MLRINEIGVTDNFFDLGGHSLLAMRLLAQIDRVFGQRLPVATVFRAQTVEQMAVVLSQHSSKPWSSVVTLQPLGLQPPLFVLPGAYGNTLAYADFARLLGPDQPVHVLQPVGFEGYGKPLERIESIAEHCIKEIRRLQPTGPYRLAGFCIGGIVAFEMAQQLIAAGEEPPLLALIDTWHPASIRRSEARRPRCPADFSFSGARQASPRPPHPSPEQSGSPPAREQRHCQTNDSP